ncbi:hypothetical protein WJX72_012340 [[Myrmecia] bisecta]|uniref:Uncharacterized protein n=1 Tax=[Myrmecia] bisecta TaxID=41462 RepID=A0AAW1PUL8_9CHLO
MADRMSPDGLINYCRSCCDNPQAGVRMRPDYSAAGTAAANAAAAAAAALVQAPAQEPVANKVCLDCHEDKLAREFGLERTSADGLRRRCKACEAKALTERRAGRPARTHPLVERKVCRRCHVEKPATEFPRKQTSTDGIDCHCKACHCRATQQRVQRRGIQPMPTVEVKLCGLCGVNKPADSFFRDRNKPDGLKARCKECENTNGRVKRKAIDPVLAPLVTHKLCIRCKEEKPAEEFPRKRYHKDGLDRYCKACNCFFTAERLKRKQPVLEPTVTRKECNRCGEEKDADEFPRQKYRPDGLYGFCRKCKSHLDTIRKREKRTVGSGSLADEDQDQDQDQADAGQSGGYGSEYQSADPVHAAQQAGRQDTMLDKRRDEMRVCLACGRGAFTDERGYLHPPIANQAGVITAHFQGYCPHCLKSILAGHTLIAKEDSVGWICYDCALKHRAEVFGDKGAAHKPSELQAAISSKHH